MSALSAVKDYANPCVAARCNVYFCMVAHFHQEEGAAVYRDIYPGFVPGYYLSHVEVTVFRVAFRSVERNKTSRTFSRYSVIVQIDAEVLA